MLEPPRHRGHIGAMSDPRPPFRSLLVALAVVLPALVLVVGVGFWWTVPRENAAVTEECRASQGLAQRLRPAAKGEVAAVSVARAPSQPPEIAFAGPSGRAMTLADFRGKVALVNLWATWCVPCREEMPALDKLQGTFGGGRFEVVAINVDTRNPEKPKAWLQENGIRNLGYYAEPTGKLLQVLQRSGHVVGLPTTLLVDEAGCEIAILKGPAAWASPDALALVRAALGAS
jgi:thiol-disulfide isomerase/thioredoxin